MNLSSPTTSIRGILPSRAAMVLACIAIGLCVAEPKTGLLFLLIPVTLVLSYQFAFRPKIFIAFIVIYTPFEEFVIKWMPLALQGYARFAPEALVLLVFVIVVFDKFYRREAIWQKNPLNLPLLLFFIAVIASAVINVVPPFIVLASLKNLLRYVVLFYLISFIELPLGFIKRLTGIMMIVALIQAILGLAETMFGLQLAHFLRSPLTGFTVLTGIANDLAVFAKAKPSGTIGLFSSYGAFLSFWAILAFARFLNTREKKLLALYVLLLVGTILSRSRTSWIMVLMGTLFVTYYLKRSMLSRSILFITPAILGLLALIMVEFVNPFERRVFHPTDWKSLIVFSDTSGVVARAENLLQRLYEMCSVEYWQTSPRVTNMTVVMPAILGRYPLLGLGPGTMGSEITGGGCTSLGYYPDYSHEHWLNIPTNISKWTADSGWIAILAQFGLFGLFPWWLFFFRLLKKISKNSKP